MPETRPEKRKYTDAENLALSKLPNTKTPEQLVIDNRGFLYSLIDKEFSHYYKVVGIPREDLVSAGMFGLVKAANRSKYGTFLRFASFWIRYYVYDEIRKHFFIKRQPSYCLKLNKIRRFQAKYASEHDNEPAPMSYLVEMTQLTAEVIDETIKFDENNSTSSVSLDAMLENEETGGRGYDHVMGYLFEETDISAIEFESLRNLVDKTLKGRDKEIMVKHFFEKQTLTDIAKFYGLSHTTRISQIIKRATHKLQEQAVKDKWAANVVNRPLVSRPLKLVAPQSKIMLMNYFDLEEHQDAELVNKLEDMIMSGADSAKHALDMLELAWEDLIQLYTRISGNPSNVIFTE